MFNGKKMLTAMLVLMVVLAAGTALAGDTHYKFYGKLHTSIDVLNDGNENTIALNSNTSRFGFKGEHEVKSNLTAIWQFESYVNAAQKGATTIATRNTFVGVKGSWGTFFAGIHDTPMKKLGRKVTFFHDQIGDFRSMGMGFDKRVQDVVFYVLPANDSGIGGMFAYMLDQNDWAAAEEPKTLASGMLTYKTESVLIGASYESHSKGTFTTDPADLDMSENAFRAGARYSADKFGVAGIFQTVSNVGGVDGVSGQMIGVEGLFKAAPDWHIKGAWYSTDMDTNMDNNSATQFAIGVDHPVSKKVLFYAQYAAVSNDNGAAMGLGHNGWGGTVHPSMDATTGMANNPSGFSLGSAIKF